MCLILKVADVHHIETCICLLCTVCSSIQTPKIFMVDPWIRKPTGGRMWPEIARNWALIATQSLHGTENVHGRAWRHCWFNKTIEKPYSVIEDIILPTLKSKKLPNDIRHFSFDGFRTTLYEFNRNSENIFVLRFCVIYMHHITFSLWYYKHCFSGSL